MEAVAVGAVAEDLAEDRRAAGLGALEALEDQGAGALGDDQAQDTVANELQNLVVLGLLGAVADAGAGFDLEGSACESREDASGLLDSSPGHGEGDFRTSRRCGPCHVGVASLPSQGGNGAFAMGAEPRARIGWVVARQGPGRGNADQGGAFGPGFEGAGSG